MWSCSKKFVRKYVQFFLSAPGYSESTILSTSFNLKNKLKKKSKMSLASTVSLVNPQLVSSFYSMLLWDALFLFVLYDLLSTFCVYIVWHPFQMCITNVQTVAQNRLFHIHTPKLAQKDEKSAKQTELPAWYTQNEDERWGKAPGIRRTIDVEHLRI